VHARDLLLLDEHRAQRVGEDLAACPHDLGHWAAHDLALEERRDVSVDAVDSLELVVLEVVAAEGNRVGDPDREVGDEGEVAVVHGRLEEQVVRKLVDGEEERLRDRGAKDVGHEHVGNPREVLRRDREPQLRAHQTERDPLALPLRPLQL